MANKTSIEWTDFNWNFLRGCSRVSEGCTRCYAEAIAARFSGKGQPYEGLAKMVNGKPRWTGAIGYYEEILTLPLRWKKPRKIFVNSMSDLFHEAITGEVIDKAFAVMALTPQHTYQILTKRPERMREYFTSRGEWPVVTMLEQLIAVAGDKLPYPISLPGIKWPLPNVWLGISVEDQKTYDERIPLLLDCPAKVRWLSVEPLLSHVELQLIADNGEGPDTDWIVVGGESGPNARPMHPDWARSVRDQCEAAGVPFFFKQWGEYAPELALDRSLTPSGKAYGTFHKRHHFDDRQAVYRVGKKYAGRLLDGREWNDMPEPAGGQAK